jgi:hypothetical protein
LVWPFAAVTFGLLLVSVGVKMSSLNNLNWTRAAGGTILIENKLYCKFAHKETLLELTVEHQH